MLREPNKRPDKTKAGNSKYSPQLGPMVSQITLPISEGDDSFSSGSKQDDTRLNDTVDELAVREATQKVAQPAKPPVNRTCSKKDNAYVKNIKIDLGRATYRD